MPGEIYLEMFPVDKALRVTAIDPVTGLEVIFVAPKNTMRSKIEAIAQSKLQARIERERAKTKSQPPPRRERGKLV